MRIWAVMKRDLLRMTRNPFTLLSAVIMPLVYLLILGNSLQGPLTGLPVGVVVLDDGAESRRFVGALQAIEHGPRTLSLTRMANAEEGMRALHDGTISGLIVIPERFSNDVERGVASPIGLFVDNVDAVAAGAVESAAQGALTALANPIVRFERRNGAPEIRPQEIYPRVDYDTSLVPGVVVLSIFMGSMITGAFNLVMDRFQGVHEAYLSTPLRRSDINLGVLLSGTTITLLSSGTVLVLGLLITGASVHGGPTGYLALIGVVLLTGLGMLAMMMIVLGRAGHPRIVGFISGFLNIIFFFPSGALYPVASFPGWLRAFARVNPEAHAVAALKALLFRGGDLAAAWAHVAFLAAFTALMLVISTVSMKRTL
jgi:ABC-2 type transport system permease protein